METKLYPHNIGIELVRGCNFKCAMCPVTTHQKGPMEYMQISTLQLILDKLKEEDINPNVLWFFNFGEPMAHPNFIEAMELTYKSGVFKDSYSVMHTNASYLSGEKAEAILDIPLIKKIVFSFDGFGDRESYSSLRGNHYDLVLKNIRDFSVNAKTKRPDLILETATIIPRQGEVHGLNVVSIEEATNNLRDLFEPIGVNVVTRHLHDYSGADKLGVSSCKSPVIGGCVFLEEYTLVFTTDGQVLPCCSVFDKKYAIGSIFHNSPIEMINSKKLEIIRHSTRLDLRDNIPMCKNCTLSMGGESIEYAVNTWDKKLIQGEVTNISQAYHIGNMIFNFKLEQQNEHIKKQLDSKLELNEKVLIDKLSNNYTEIAKVIEAFNERNSILELDLLKQGRLIKEKIKQNEEAIIQNDSDIKARLLRHEQLHDEELKQIKEQYCDKLDKINREHLVLINVLEQRVKTISCEKEYLTSLLFEVLERIESQPVFGRKWRIFRKGQNMYNRLKEKSPNYIDGLILNCPELKRGSILSLSNIVPIDTYYEYEVNGYGDIIKFFSNSNVEAKLIIEVVKNGNIVKNELRELRSEAIQSIYIGNIKGTCYIRFRALDNKSIVRILEIKNRKFGLFQRRRIACFIE